MANSIKFPDPPERLARGRWWQLLAFFGPGAIMASVTIGSGETVFASRAGATFGYMVLWCLLAGAIMKCIQVYGGMRFMVLTGHHPAESWGKLPGPRGWFPAVIGIISVFCFPFWICGLASMLGTVCDWITRSTDSPNDLYVKCWATLLIAVGVTVTLLQSYGFLEKAELIIVGLLLFCIGIAVIVSEPNWGQVLLGSIIPRVPEYPDWVTENYPKLVKRSPWLEMMTIMGAVGGGTYDYVGYLGIVREKGWGLLKSAGVGLPEKREAKVDLPESREEVAKARTWLRAPLIDCSVSFTAVALFSAAFLILGTTLLRPDKLIPADLKLLNHQAVFLTNVHGSLLYVYQVGIFFAFFGTVIAAYEINTRTTIECLWGISPTLKRFSLPRVRVAVVAYCALVGLGLIWLPYLYWLSPHEGEGFLVKIMTQLKNPVGVVTIPAVLGGVFACGLWCFAVLWAERRFLSAKFRMKTPMFVLTIIAGSTLTIMGVFAIKELLHKMFGS